MSDIVKRIEDFSHRISTGLNKGTRDCPSIYDAGSLCVEAKAEIVRLRATIEQLRAIAGPVSLEGSLAEIKKELRGDRPATLD